MDITWKKDTREPLSKETATINGEVFPLTIEKEKDGHARPLFRENRIVRDVLGAASAGRKYDLNDIWGAASIGRYCKEEMLEFYRLIGYTWSGYCEIFSPEDLNCSMTCDKCFCYDWVHPLERCQKFVKEDVKV
jgi:hypothetical protein